MAASIEWFIAVQANFASVKYLLTVFLVRYTIPLVAYIDDICDLAMKFDFFSAHAIIFQKEGLIFRETNLCSHRKKMEYSSQVQLGFFVAYDQLTRSSSNTLYSVHI